jgi:serine/threonine protein kinase
MDKIEAILLELRVLTHSPLRNHENIVKLIQVGWEGDALDNTVKWPVLVVDFADRGTLADFFENEPVVDFAMKRSLCLDVANGLRALHDCQIVHGDLKLLNVLVYSEEDRHVVAKLSDFGGALLDSPDALAKPMATPPWTAPEYDTLRPRSELLKSDIYALGLLIWQAMLSGNDPFCDETIFDLPKADDNRLDAIQKLKQSEDFLTRAKISISNYANDVDCGTISRIFDSSIRVAQSDRNLERVIFYLQDIQAYLKAIVTALSKTRYEEISDEEIENFAELQSDENPELRVSVLQHGNGEVSVPTFYSCPSGVWTFTMSLAHWPVECSNHSLIPLSTTRVLHVEQKQRSY